MANYRYDSSVAPSAEEGDTLTTRIYTSLRDEIIAGDIKPGERMVRRKIGSRMGVSHIPVTEALLKLEVDGLVESKPLLGCRVKPLTIEDIRNDEILREAIECQTARLFAEHADDEMMTRLMLHARRLDRVSADADSQSRLGMDLHKEFHLMVAQGGGYPVLGQELSRVWFRRLMRVNWIKSTRFRPTPGDWHQQLAEVLMQRDPDMAERKMREHVQFGHENDQQALAAYIESESLGKGGAS